MTIFLLIQFFLRSKSNLNVAKIFKYLFLVLLAMLVSFNATPQVTAEFTTITSRSGCGSLVVEFTDLSLGSPTSWLWDFGNGNTSILKNPTTIYSIAGEYDVTLKVDDVLTSDIKTIISYINIFERPSAIINSNFVTGCMPLNTSFEDASITSHAIASWQWDFGDGGSSSIQNPDYIYYNNGTYTVSLLIEDINGCYNLVSEIDLVIVENTPVAEFSSDISFSCDSSELVSFSNTSIFADTYLWEFGDGTISNASNPSHNYISGTYSVTLIAEKGNCLDTLVMPNLIEIIGNLSPYYTVNSNSGCDSLSVIFSNETSVGANIFLWEFGDGEISILQNPNHVYDSIGIYDIALTASIDGECSTTAIFSSDIAVFASPIISFTADTTQVCSLPFNVNFNDNTINAVYWSWDFGDGNISYSSNPSNIYSESGEYDVSLLVQNDYGCQSSSTFEKYIIANQLSALNFSAYPETSCAGEDITFFQTSSLLNSDFEWDFGDGNTSSSQSPIHQYEQTGDYNVSLIANVSSCKDTFTIFDYIKIIQPSAIFEEIYNCDIPLEVEFISYTIGADHVFWDFGDGTTSTLLNPIHTFSNFGIQNVSLSVSNNLTGCEHIFVKQIELTKPVANFNYLINNNNSYQDSVGCLPERVYINNMSEDYTWFKMLWSEEDISFSPTHLYTENGIYDVTMIVFDIHDCRDTFVIENMYNIYENNIDFVVSNILGCDSMFIEFENFSNHPLAEIYWDFGDGKNSQINNPNNIYYDEGSYDVALYTKSIYGCKDTLNRSDYVRFQSPSANLNTSIQNICIGDDVQFSNLSDGIGIRSLWSFGDGTTSNLSNPNNEFLVNGIYNINLLITDSFGCQDDTSSYIQVLSPIANFSSLNLDANCPPLISDFINLSTYDAIYFEWIFNDGSISTVENPSHLFSNSGIYDISLIVENSFGCKDTLIKNDFIDMSGSIPMGSFIVSDTLICKGDIISFYPSVINTDNFLWDFGNGVVSNDSVTTTSYSNAGNYTPSLIIENSSGCQQTLNYENIIIVNEAVVDAGLDVEICEGELVQLNAVGNGFQFIWSPISALTSATVMNPLTNTDSSIMYYVTHTSGLCTAVDSVYINVHNEVPNASFIASNFCDGNLTSLVANSGLTTINNAYMWSFGQYGKLVNTVLNVGNNNVVLIIENLNNSCRDTINQNIEIFENPVADFFVSDIISCLGDTISFTNNSIANSSIISYSFGDGIGLSTVESPEYMYSIPGTYSVSLNITTYMGCEDDIIKELIIHENPIVNFTAVNNCEREGNVFTDLSYVINGSISTIQYDFNDGHFSNDSISLHVFDGYGSFDVKLISTSDNGCSSNIIKTTEVYANPRVDFVASQFCVGEPTIFNNISIVPNSDIIANRWGFGSEEYSLNINNIYTFLSDGVYDVSLLVTSEMQCKSILTKKIKIFRLPIANFQIDLDICVGDEANISYISNDEDATVVKWNYNFGDGHISSERNAKHIYNNANSFDVSLEVVSSQGCKNDTIMPSIIEVHSLPIADFQSSKSIASELNSEISFINYSEDAILFMWNFDNGNYSIEENPTYSFVDADTYNVSLIATSQFGCFSEIIREIKIYPEYTLFIPEVFTPDGDGLNDLFLAKGNRMVSFEMRVFDRWGGVIFKSSSINSGWDGTNFNGEQLDEGVYLYDIEIYDLNDRLWAYNGQLRLMR